MRVLFLCTENSFRSQMAEGLLRALSHGAVESFSAGSEPTEVHPMAVESMRAIDIDISHQTSKHLDWFLHEKFDYVITVCDRVKDSCPTWPEAKEDIHWSFEDPARIADPGKARRVCDAVRDSMVTRMRLFLLAHRIGVDAGRPLQ